MSLGLIILITVAGLYVGWNIGANDSGNCIGASVGAGLIRYRTAIILVAIFVVLGALLGGGGVINTVGKGIVTDPLSAYAVLSALLCGGIFVTIATFLKVPVSTSQSVVGGVAGVGLAADLTVNFSKIITIVECWVLCPIMSCILSYFLYRGLRFWLRNMKSTKVAERILMWGVLVSASYAAYSLGANNLGNAIGPIVVLDVVDFVLLTVLGSLSMAVGALTFGRGVAETVGKSITKLDLPGAFSAQVSAAFGLHFFSMIGIPVSTSQAIVGSVLGVGLVHGTRTVSKRKLVEIVVGWVATPLISGSVAFAVYTLIMRFG
jgi:inorganic phosphate transporter, PiT family